MTPSNRAIKVWLQLFRAPNLFTVPGDPLAGFFLASSSFPELAFDPIKAALAMVASLFFYAAGLLINDLADFEVDLKERPFRPLPSGQAGFGPVLGVAIGLLLSGLGMCAWMGAPSLVVGAILVGGILAYNLILKNKIIGPAIMGCCRASSLLLGATAAGPTALPDSHVSMPVWAAVSLLGVYITGVTWLSKNEASDKRIPPWIGLLISFLLFFQAGCILYSGSDRKAWIVALVLIALWPVSRLTSKRFYAS